MTDLYVLKHDLILNDLLKIEILSTGKNTVYSHRTINEDEQVQFQIIIKVEQS